jgi:hypothetical protein
VVDVVEEDDGDELEPVVMKRSCWRGWRPMKGKPVRKDDT